MWRRFFRWMMSVFPQVRVDDYEREAPEKYGPVADIQAPGSPNSKPNHPANHYQLLTVAAFVTLFFDILFLPACPDQIDPQFDGAWETKPGGPEEPETPRILFTIQTYLFFWSRL
jgi:hypothetical protein